MLFLYYELKSTHLPKEKKIMLAMDFFSYSKKKIICSLKFWDPGLKK